jgi:hypothetical protein
MSDDKTKKVKTKAQIQTEKNAAEKKANGFLNPFSPGVTYEAFLKTLGKDETVAGLLKGKISDDQLEWLLNDLQHTKN